MKRFTLLTMLIALLSVSAFAQKEKNLHALQGRIQHPSTMMKGDARLSQNATKPTAKVATSLSKMNVKAKAKRSLSATQSATLAAKLATPQPKFSLNAQVRNSKPAAKPARINAAKTLSLPATVNVEKLKQSSFLKSVSRGNAHNSQQTAKAPKRIAADDVLVAPPADAEVETWYTTGGNFYYKTQSGLMDFTSSKKTVNVVIDGSDIYIQGLSYFFSDAWIKGTIEGDEAIFENGQFIGSDQYGSEYLVGSEDDETVAESIIFEYDAEQGILETVTQFIYESEAPDDFNSIYSLWVLPVFSIEAPEQPDLVTPPETATVETWYTIDGQFLVNTSEGFEDYTSAIGTVNVAIDGDDLYIQGLAYYFDEAWIKGTIVGDEVIFDNSQYVGEDDYGPEYLVGTDDGETLSDFIVFSYDAEQGILSAVTPIIVESGEAEELYPYAFWAQPTFTNVIPDLVTPPADATVETWYTADGKFYLGTSDGFADNTSNMETVNVAFGNNNDIYIQGLAYWFDDAWIKGTIEGEQAIFENGQFVGADNTGLEYLVASDDGQSVTDFIVFNYNSDEGILEATNSYIIESGADDAIYAFTYWSQPTFTRDAPEKPDLVTPPETATIETWYTADGYYYVSLMGDFYNITDEIPTVNVAIDGDDIYVQGLAYYFPEGWIKGTIVDDMAVFDNSQFVGEDEYGPEYLVGSDDYETVADFIVFSYDAEQGVLAAVTPLIAECSEADELSLYGYWDQPTFTREAPIEPELVEVPEDLVTEQYVFTYIDYKGETVTSFVNVGFDGNDVYIQGISDYLPEAWVKGTLEGTTITFPGYQYLGKYSSYQLFLQEDDIVFNYDAEADKMTATDVFHVYTKDGIDADSYEEAIIFKVMEIAATPATPEITQIKESSFGPIVYFDIPLVDVDGNLMVTSKVSFQFFSEVDHAASPVVFNPEEYDELTEAMSVIPYGFTDSWDFYSDHIYFNMADFENWNRIGIQTTYTGQGEENKSEIFWFTLKEYEYVLGDVNHDGVVSVTDVMLVVDYVMGNNPTNFFIEQADVTGDGDITVQDVTNIVDVALNGSGN